MEAITTPLSMLLIFLESKNSYSDIRMGIAGLCVRDEENTWKKGPREKVSSSERNFGKTGRNGRILNVKQET